ncbi:MAG: hypothetical protein Q3966_04870 [Neisseria sp.]|nr:hypothetical protein [Neisseria sp.]
MAKKWLPVGVLLMIFAVLKVWAVLWWQGKQPKVSETAACDVAAGCRLANGAVVAFGGKVGLKTPFEVVVREVSAQSISVSFTMRDMDMGFNRFDLRQEGGVWKADGVRLPFCTEARHDFLADITIDGKVYRVPFSAY